MRLSNASSSSATLFAFAIVCSLFTSVRANAVVQRQAVAASCPAENRLTTDVPAGSEVASVLCTTDIQPDTQVRIGAGTDEMEVVTVIAVAKDSFRARIRRAHKEGSTVEILTSPPRGSTETGSDKNNGGTNKPSDHGVESKPCKVEIHYKSDRGKITVGCPKVWRSDRVFTVLDGILRDVDSITVKALQDLDPNAVNAAELIRLVTDFQAAVKFDQAAAINSGLERQKISAERSRDLENFNADKANNELIQKHKAELLKEKFDLEDKERDLASKGQTDPIKDPLKTLKAQQTVVDAQLAKLSPAPPPSSIPGGTTGTTGSGSTDGQTGGSGVAGPTNSTIPTQALTAASSTSATAVTASTTPSTAIPDSLKAVLQQALQNPSLPASMRLDNVIELLHQRLAREFSVLYDDLSRQTQTYDVYLVQFDIGVVPFHAAKNRDARVELEFDKDGVQAQAYELYPGTSSYNILRGLDKTSRIGLSGMAQTVLGLGISASFAREKNQLRSGLSQSLFVSGFGAGRSNFGWQIGSSPFDDLITPGSRIVNAILLVPKREKKQIKNLVFTARYCWPKRENRYDFRGAALKTALMPTHLMGFPALDFGPVDEESCAQDPERDKITMVLPQDPQLTIKRISYNPTTLKETPGTQASTAATDKPNTVQITFNEPVDPNLTITVADKLINRVRDVRGRALFGATAEDLAGTANERKLLTDSRFGILEKDTLGPDTWIQLNSKAILLSISKETAGTDTFPTITLSDPGWGGEELNGLAKRPLASDETWPEIRIGEWLFQNTEVHESAFLPLFTQPYQPGRTRAYIDQVQNSLPGRIRVISETRYEGRANPVWLHEQAQVILVAKPKVDPKPGYPDHWAMKCDGDEGTLSCKVPADLVAQSYTNTTDLDRFKVWIDEPPYLERPGLWSDTDLVRKDAWSKEPYAKGDWTSVREICDPPFHKVWNAWETKIDLKNLDPNKTYKIEESGLEPQLVKLRSAFLQEKTKDPALKEYTHDLVERSAPFIAPDQKDNNPKKRGQRDQPSPHEPSELIKIIDPMLTDGVLKLRIAFEAIPLLPEQFHLVSTDKSVTVTLPPLVPRLTPSPVRFTVEGNGYYHIEGDHLKAVDRIRLENAGNAILAKTTVGYNSVDFFVDPKQLTDKATYNIFAVISGLTVPLYQENAKKKLEQVSFSFEKPKDDKKSTEKQGSENGDSQAGKENTSVKLRMDIDLKTDAEAEANASKTAKPDKKPSGTSQAGKKNTGAAGGTAARNKAQPTKTPAYNAGAQK